MFADIPGEYLRSRTGHDRLRISTDRCERRTQLVRQQRNELPALTVGLAYGHRLASLGNQQLTTERESASLQAHRSKSFPFFQNGHAVGMLGNSLNEGIRTARLFHGKQAVESPETSRSIQHPIGHMRLIEEQYAWFRSKSLDDLSDLLFSPGQVMSLLVKIKRHL